MRVLQPRRLLLNLLLLTAPMTVWAGGKNLTGRVGFGATDVGAGYSTPALSAEWNFSQSTGMQVNFGIDTVNGANSLQISARYLRNLFIEDSLFYSLYVGAGLLTSTASSVSSSGYLVDTGMMARFFLPNLPNLGLEALTGFRLESPGSVRIRTTLGVGVRYYF
jgi:hypothetical protein